MRRRLWWNQVLVACTGLAAFLPASDGPLPLHDDPLYAEVARDVRESGRWLAPSVAGYTYVEKPPLLFWALALSTAIFGETEVALRLPSALFAVGTLLLVFGFLFRATGLTAPGWVAVLSLLASAQFLENSRRVLVDMPLTFFSTLAAVSALAAMRRSDGKGLIATGIAIGAAFMAKGFAAAVVVLGVFLILAVSKQLRLALTRRFALGMLAALLIVLPWHLYVFMKHTEVFADAVLGLHLRDQILAGQRWLSGGPFFYLVEIAQQDLSTGVLFALGVAAAWAFAWRDRDFRCAAFALSIVLFGTLILFSSVPSKTLRYILPCYPIGAMLIGLSWSRLFPDGAIERPHRKLLRMGLAVTVLGSLFIVNNVHSYDADRDVLAVNMRDLGLAMRRDSDRDDVLLTLQVYQTSLQFYSRRKTIELTNDSAHLKDLLSVPYIRDAGIAKYMDFSGLRAMMTGAGRLFLVGKTLSLAAHGRSVPTFRFVATSGDWALARTFVKENDTAMTVDELLALRDQLEPRRGL